MSRTRDAELRALVEAHPTDAGAILVYADWLEEQGDTARASFLRLQQQLRAMTVSHPRLLARGRALFALGKTLDPAWVSAMTYPKLAGTAWDGRDDHGPLVWRFLASGLVNYTQPSGTFENGHWEQVGNAVAMETNAHYADYFGVIAGDVIRGDARNIVGHAWWWKVNRTDDPRVAPVPDIVSHTIHVPRTATAKPKRKPKARPRPLPRKSPLRRKTKLAARANLVRRTR